MSRRPRLLGRRLLPMTVSVLAGLALGVGVSGLPDTEALNPIAVRPPLTVKPGALVDPTELTVPPMVRSSSTLSPTASTATATSSTTSVVEAAPAASLSIMVANGNGSAGIATKWAGELVTLGYSKPQVGDTSPTETWVVYYVAEFEQDATRLARELSSVPGASPVVIAPIDEAPTTQPGFEGQLLVVIGAAIP